MSTTSQLQLGTLIRNSMLELILTSALLFGVTTFVRFVVGPSPISSALPQIHVQLFLVGALVAVLLSLLIMSRAGKVSGGHMNPAISLAMWRFGVFPAVGIVPYIAAQLLGSILGALAARVVWGEIVARPPVLYAVIQPAPVWSSAPLFAAELKRRQLKSCAPIWARSRFRTHSQTLGVLSCSDGGRRTRSTAAPRFSKTKTGAHAPTVRDSS